MNNNKKSPHIVFPKQYLFKYGVPESYYTEYVEDEEVPENELAIIISNKIINHSRWAIQYEVIFRFPNMPENEAWKTNYQIGATEEQEEYPFQYVDNVDCYKVYKKEKTITIWE